ncbi:hypothetical protein Hypma_007728 [Hypsizygus marmoreus]|uniref:F-box domain-containing protein n=1 Tax=Hypsizygus marmoreus TaxID=39966 RepID=A0A369JXL9_HYPMA|nr:hypothetical protein Hypma_007728 [Hypsizygus marmoreus]
MPNLWCSLRVVVTRETAYPAPNLVSRWLYNSGSLPLTLSLYQENEAVGNQRATGQILELYKQYISRWKHIRFDLAGPQPHALLGPLENPAPLLEKFHMRTYRLYVNLAEDLFKIFEQPAPQLAKLAVSAIPSLDFWRDNGSSIPWDQLTSLSVDFVMSVGTALNLVGACHNIQHCFLGIESVPGPNPPPRATHRILQSLELSIECDDLSVFLDYTILPALTNLVIRGKNSPGPHGWPQAQLSKHLKRSDASLRHVALHNTWINDIDLSDFIGHSAAQTLTKLIIEDDTDWAFAPCLSYAVVKKLTFDSGAQNIQVLPALESLHIKGVGCLWCVDMAAMMDMVESRWRRYRDYGAARLGTLELRLPASFQASVEGCATLGKLQEEGLEVI